MGFRNKLREGLRKDGVAPRLCALVSSSCFASKVFHLTLLALAHSWPVL